MYSYAYFSIFILVLYMFVKVSRYWTDYNTIESSILSDFIAYFTPRDEGQNYDPSQPFSPHLPINLSNINNCDNSYRNDSHTVNKLINSNNNNNTTTNLTISEYTRYLKSSYGYARIKWTKFNLINMTLGIICILYSLYLYIHRFYRICIQQGYHTRTYVPSISICIKLCRGIYQGDVYEYKEYILTSICIVIVCIHGLSTFSNSFIEQVLHCVYNII